MKVASNEKNNSGAAAKNCCEGTDKGRQTTFELARFLCHVAYHLPDDVKNRIVEMAGRETNEASKKTYLCMLENLRLAHELSRPLCQDTGIPTFYVKAGADWPHLGILKGVIEEASAEAFALAPLRPNAVDPFTNKNTGNNAGPCSPYIDWEIVPGDEAEITVYLAGGGCSLPGFAAVLTPGEGIEKAKQLIIDKILEKGVNACPPLIIGVGIGASADVAAKLSKKALLRPVGSSSQGGAAELEKELFEALNRLGIGPGGIGGTESVLGVNVIAGVRHPATFAVALSTGCWGTRRGTVRLDRDLNMTFPDHKEFS